MSKLITHNIEQRSDEWLQLKAGKMSGSRVGKIITKSGKPTDAFRSMVMELAAERLTGRMVETPISYAMQQGIDLEPDAIEIYANHAKADVKFVGGFEFDNMWYSPDGVIGEKGLLEVKCPLPKQHLSNLLQNKGEVDSKYMAQLQFGLWITGREWIDFVSFNPDFPDHFAIKITTVTVDKAYREKMVKMLGMFEGMVGNMIGGLK